MSKPEIVFSFPACMGGVASFNYNIINNSKLIKNFRSKIILLKSEEDKRPLFNDKFLADEIILFNYSVKENRYHVLKRLNKELGVQKGAIVTDNSLTIQAAGLFYNPKTVFNLLHDKFYVNETIQLGDLVDVAIAHSSFFSDALYASNPVDFAGRSFYIPYGVKQTGDLPVKKNVVLKLVFLGRLIEEKGVKLLYEINEGLLKKKILVEWTIIGKGPLKDFLKKQWKSSKNVIFCEPHSTTEVYTLLASQDIFVFPCTFEGTPVSILECAANGVITITNDLPGGIRDIVTSEVGFRCQLNNISEFVENIAACCEDKNHLAEIQSASYALASRCFNIEKNADLYFQKFIEYDSFKRSQKAKKIKLSRLDKPFIPNSFVKIIRSIIEPKSQKSSNGTN